MEKAGPALEILTRRIAEVPADFLDEPRIGDRGRVSVPAVVHDLMRLHGARISSDELRRFVSGSARADRNRLAVALIAAWLLADEWFVTAGLDAAQLLEILDTTAAELASASASQKYTHDAQRREELARIVLARLGFRPHGETVAQATDRLSALSITERRRLLEASREAERRARELREALAKKAAEESADKWTRD